MKTEELKYVLETFSQIVKIQPLRPVTSFVELFCKDGALRIGTTDGYTKIVATLSDDNEMNNVVLDRDQLLKLIKLTNKEDIKIIRKDDYVAIRGCGNYKLPIQCDETGTQVALNLKMPKMENGMSCNINGIKEIFNRNSLCLGDADTYPFLNQYYSENGKVFTTDVAKACTTKAVLPQQVMPSEVIKKIATLDKDIVFMGDNQGARVDSDIFQIYFMYDEPIEYPADTVRPFMGTDWAEFSFVLNKSELVNALKRITIFSKPWQSGKCILTFEDSCVTILGENQDANETLDIKLEGRACRMVTSAEEILLILRKIEPEFTIYGSQRCIGFEDSKGLYVLSLMEES